MSSSSSSRDPRQQLFDAATRVLTRGGVAALTSRAVTDEAGVAKGVLHRHFADFDAFLVDLVLERIGSRRKVPRCAMRPGPGLLPATSPTRCSNSSSRSCPRSSCSSSPATSCATACGWPAPPGSPWRAKRSPRWPAIWQPSVTVVGSPPRRTCMCWRRP
ncbi:TetR/AcrR family transcriptional regulator [Micromonospora sp. DT31]|uniref:TetR/AcrR family transcriptional regulator n=1 Tax=Micromonospora sp. DT31 TaxID=3393434 RepID=UPI003CEE86BE